MEENLETIDELIAKSRKAQEGYAFATQEQVDKITREVCKYVYDHAEELAEMAVTETKLGNVADKTAKNKTKALLIWNSMIDVKTVGVINESVEGIVEIAKPMGVVASICPTTNAIVTPMSNAAFALKTRNSIIFSPHPSALNCAIRCTEAFKAIVKENGFDENLVQTIHYPSLDKTKELMQKCDVVVATGGNPMVKSAYSSGKPAYGVGAGNVQCIVDRGVDYEEVAGKIVSGRIFDNGIICSGEQMAIIPEEAKEEMLSFFEQAGAFYIDDESEIEKARNTLFPNGAINKKLVGKSVKTIAEALGLTIPEETKALLLEVRGNAQEDVLCKEKMFPVIGLKTYRTLEEAGDLALADLKKEGIGHSVVFHSNSREHILALAEKMPVSRFIVNQVSSGAAGGSLYNNLKPTTTLGCGSWGNNSISDNFNFRHLLNTTRISYPLPYQRQLKDTFE